ncbi:hypothetical protein BDA96_07G049600 [Sorghum bicolor]|uniref:Knottin scorpion toxin-like domain-containing protein n=2 Tax=Sorghum bicolor TaxID=4558 RepID=A0A921U8D8_SORBI|nr:uncharacterized protein LOC110436841 [Sorghum bicolor]KAG0522582.1 hypothetical protein BDA96_07G049600 [Sorghum bicolor]KXG24475.1 hypothetical protein SORBI_3007G047000 [Sorghum bicolor]|eukprot:XP_021320081.1 uncharacterized protein LOC110436841 [Sorghum bicolor]
MALLKSNDTRALFLAAIVVMAMVLTPCPAHGANDEKCEHMPGCTISKCRDRCKQWGYGNPVINCWNTPPDTVLDTCCCFSNAARKLA